MSSFPQLLSFLLDKNHFGPKLGNPLRPSMLKEKKSLLFSTASIKQQPCKAVQTAFWKLAFKQLLSIKTALKCVEDKVLFQCICF